ncbi:hypothetical protein [Desulfurispora thermophila]|uniref:hypothetical protein n=1 Tax=Desulfurispora thermophila TaxID=265470 RepID=UPI0012EA3B2B|nr:hypothetical protein [Desulfurispora thermophila]
MELWLEHILELEDASEVISPLFVLYDLRISMDHLQSSKSKEEGISFACERICLNKDERDYLIIFDALINKLNQMYEKINQALDSLAD